MASALAGLADLLDPPKVDALGTLGFAPNCAKVEEARKARRPIPAPCGECPQERFLAADEYDVGYGGALGGGKTFALVMVGIRACAENPGLTVGAFRRTYPELEANFIKELSRTGYAQALGARWKESKRELHFPNGSVLMCRYCENMADATRYQGAEFQLLLIDERTLLAPDVVEFLKSRVRSGRIGVPVLGIRSTFNPGGPGHANVKAEYVDATDHGAKTVSDARTGRTRRFIPAKATDNPHLNAEYLSDLNSLPDALRAAFRDGSWDSFVGQVFAEWRHDRHVVPRRSLPATWVRYTGIDYGHRAPWAALTAARDGDGRVWLYREHYGALVLEREQARRILTAESSSTAASVSTEGIPIEVPEPVGIRAADPAMWNKTGEALSVADQYALEGCAVRPATNDRLIGWQRVHTYLADGPACEYHRGLGWDTCPMLHVLDGTCPNLVRTLPALPYDPHKVEDVDTKAEDHAADAVRYMLMEIGVSPSWFMGADDPETALDGSPLMRDIGGGLAMAPATSAKFF